ncbi:MAG: NAD(P)/FAD-dependent oxidoreductase [Chitinophagaceae bacterium]
MESTEILIIGAGAAGLMAARTLSSKGKKVIILEARDRIGGRIYTLNDAVFQLPVELGAEFVHGKLELTLNLLHEAGIEPDAISGELWRSENGRLHQQEDFIEDQEELMEKLKSLEQDMSVNAFLQKYFGGEKYADLRKSLTSFVQGYDAADADHASTFALLQELLGEDNDTQYRVRNGYSGLMDFLKDESVQAGCIIHLSTVVSSVNWQPGKVNITTTDNRRFSSEKLIITIPIPVLQSRTGEEGHIVINPLPQQTYDAIYSLGSTGVIKIILQFSEAFWKDAAVPGNNKTHKEIGFLFGDTKIPTWWTQLPEDNAMITGWLAGPDSLLLKDADDDVILNEALASLSKIFSKDTNELREQLVAWHIANWTSEPFTLGAYGYEKVESKNAKRILNEPLENTIFFAGEGVYEGPARGTVEAALVSGLEAAEKLADGMIS